VQYCVQQLCTVQCTHIYIYEQTSNSCLLVRFSFSVIILRVTVYLCQMCMRAFIVSSVLCQEISEEECLQNDVVCVECDVKS